MKTYLLFGIFLILSSCSFRPKDKTSLDLNKLSDTVPKEIGTKFHYDYLFYDSILLNCKIKPFLSFDELVSSFGKPDTVIKYIDEVGFIGDPFSTVVYGDTRFWLYDNNHTVIRKFYIGDTENKVCYKSLEFNRSTLLNDLSELFPNSYLNRDSISIGNEHLIAVRFNTSNRPTDSQFIMLFLDNKLKYFDYFNGDD